MVMVEKVKIIRKKSQKSLSMSVERDGTVVIKAPPTVPDERIAQFLEQNRNWIEKVISRYEEKNLLKRYRNGEKFLYLGKEYELLITDKQIEPLILKDKFYLHKNSLENARDIFLAWYKREAKRVIDKRVKHYASLGGYNYSKVTVKDLQTRWGSCTSKGNLAFNWRIIMAPIEVLDYVVVHELSHLREMNHSKRFWQEVERLMPDYEEKDKWLRKNGHLLDF